MEARVELLENKAELSEREEKELERKGSIYDKLLSNLDKLRAKEARLEDRLEKELRRSVPDALAYPQAIKNPSEAKADDVNNACEMGSFADLPVALELLKCFDVSISDSNMEAAKAVLEGLNSSMESSTNIGLFRRDSGAMVGELSMTSVLTSCLAAKKLQIGTLEARWLHQIVDRGGGQVDILCCTMSKTNVWNVVMLGEAGFMVACKAKEVQVAAYGVNVSPMLMCGEVFLLFELIMKPKSANHKNWLRVSAACLPAEKQKLLRVKIWEGIFDESSCAGLLNACDAVSLYNQNLNRRPATEKISENVWKCDGRIYKVYDYRNRGVEKDERRDHNHSVKLIRGTVIELSKEDMNVISYPEMEGACTPSSVEHIISLIRAVKALHEKGIVHADVRASNVVFCPNGEAVLIDFDWSGKPNERNYPKGFRLEINDGARAKDVKAGQGVEFSHDYFSVGAIMASCKVAVEAAKELVEAWEGVIVLLRDNDAASAKLDPLLEKLSQFKTTGIKFKSAIRTKTGSPQREQAAKQGSSSTNSSRSRSSTSVSSFSL